MIKGMKIGLQLYSVRNDAVEDLKGTLKKVRAMGYECVEFSSRMFGYSPRQVGAWLDETGLESASAHVGFDDLNGDLETIIKTYKTIGCKYLVMPWLNEPRRPGNPEFEQVKKDLSRIAPECKKHDMILLYHNHDFEFLKIDGEYALDMLYREIPDMQSQIDTCWAKAAGVDPAEYILKYSGRVPVVHLKDFVGSKGPDKVLYELVGKEKRKVDAGGKFDYRPLGMGRQDVPALICAAAKAGTEWLIVEQDQPSLGMTPMECAKKSAEYLLNPDILS